MMKYKPILIVLCADAFLRAGLYVRLNDPHGYWWQALGMIGVALFVYVGYLLFKKQTRHEG